MWLNALKVAVVEKDTNKFENLLKDIPTYTDKKKIEEALFLIEAAKEILVTLKSETKASMIKVKKHMDFLNSTRMEKKSRFDITS
jgi:hypothetical protein